MDHFSCRKPTKRGDFALWSQSAQIGLFGDENAGRIRDLSRIEKRQDL